MRLAVGIDIGGTGIKAALVAENGRILKIAAAKTEAAKGKKQVIKNVIAAAEKVFDKKASGIGIGCPGPLDIKKGVIGKSVNIPLSNVPLKKIIKNHFKKPVFLDNDANCFVFGEAIFGAGKNRENIVGLTLGTGIGGGIVINKKIYHGRNNAGELGHMTIKFDGAKSRCGNNGCIESYAGKKGILRIAKNPKIKNPKELYELAKKGNKKAIRAFDEMGFYLGIASANIVNAFDPDIIVIGGNVAKSWKFFHKKMEKETAKRALFRPCKLVNSKLDNAAAMGAAALVFNR